MSDPGSVDRWLAALSAEEKAAGQSGGHVTIAPTREDLQVTVALVRRPVGCKIASWTWTGPAATPVK